MKQGLEIAFFGSSLVSAYWNGAATYYRGIIKNLHLLGHRVTFFEPDAFERQQHRDMEDPTWAQVHVYPATTAGVYRAIETARKRSDCVVKASGVGVFDELLERELLLAAQPHQTTIFWDVDAPATLDRLAQDASDAFHACVPKYDMVLTYGGGDPVVRAYKAAGARECIPVYNALDPETHYPVAPEERLRADVGFLGNRLPDREARVDEFFFRAAAAAAAKTFLLGGNGWGDRAMPRNVRYVGHVYTAEHNAFNCTPFTVLNISRASMARYGFSPATRIFEAAGAGACLITDKWEGIEQFLEPDIEVLVANDGAEVAGIVSGLAPAQARAIGQAALRRVLAQHTYAHRARQVDAILSGRFAMAGK